MSSQGLSQTHGCCGLALTKRSGSDTSDNDITTVSSVLQSLHETKVNLGLVCAVSRSIDNVLHQHGNSHGSDTARNRGDGGSNLNCRGVVHIANKSVARLLGRIGKEVSSDIDDNGSRLDPAARNKERLANSGDENICVSDMLLNVLCLGVHDGNSGVGISQEITDGATDNVTSSEDNGILALQVNTRLLEKDHATLGCARNEKRLATPLGELSNVFGAEAVDILLVCHKRCNGILRNVLGERQLNQDTMDSRVVVVLTNMVKELCLGDRFRIVQQLAVNASLQ
ncbi:hypothetical protein HG531_007735 [Fusarium graminearum]|nr:hypothetical protein HG531_007735 [Fusarium graminearum]